MTPDSARMLPITVTTGHCAFALQRIALVGESPQTQFGSAWPWFELLIRPNQQFFRGSPGAFIDKLYAERAPEDTDAEVLGRAIDWLMARADPTRLSVNIHPHSLTRTRFMDQVIAAQRKVHRGGHSLCLELVEFGECPHRSLLASNAHRLRDAGVLIALDDFGSRLNCFDLCAEGIVDLIKVDASVVRNIHVDGYRQAIVHSIKTLGRGINAAIIAEGVESQEELHSLARMGVEFAQGYHFHKPEVAEI